MLSKSNLSKLAIESFQGMKVCVSLWVANHPQITKYKNMLSGKICRDNKYVSGYHVVTSAPPLLRSRPWSWHRLRGMSSSFCYVHPTHIFDDCSVNVNCIVDAISSGLSSPLQSLAGILDSDWSTPITWPGYWPLIGQSEAGGSAAQSIMSLQSCYSQD